MEGFKFYILIIIFAFLIQTFKSMKKKANSISLSKFALTKKRSTFSIYEFLKLFTKTKLIYNFNEKLFLENLNKFTYINNNEITHM